MPTFTIDPELRQCTPEIRLGVLSAIVDVQPSSAGLLDNIKGLEVLINENESIEEIHSIPIIEETRAAYKIFGKEPSRYRPSAEALRRRVIQGKGLYQINNLVEIINLCSLRSGYSIGGYDTSKIRGKITLGLGEENEVYKAIGRGSLNIQYLPVLRDSISAFGSPTSDSQRTMITDSTNEVLIVYFDFCGNDLLEQSLEQMQLSLKNYANARNINQLINS